jgi:adenine-specific DNA-methyltransferase
VVQKNKTMAEQDFIKAGFTVVGTENNENKLLSFLKENYPNVIRDTEINLEELKAVLGLPVDEKVNGYGLNFVGRNFARAKYAQKTEKELRLNNTLSKNIDTTENLVLKGDNLDSLKILKNHYSGKIKCIYIDPPYNTAGDEFVYPDKFDKEEAEVLGLANLSESDFARMEFSFKTKKSHNGWLAFMYPRLLLARDLLSKDGVIFISIDDNEQANLKLLCDEIFGEENFEANVIPIVNPGGRDYKQVAITNEYILAYSKSELSEFNELPKEADFQFKDSKGGYNLRELRNRNPKFHSGNRPNLFYPFYVNPESSDKYCSVSLTKDEKHSIEVKPYNSVGKESVWRWSKEKSEKNNVVNNLDLTQLVAKQKADGNWNIYEKNRRDTTKAKSVWDETEMRTENGTRSFRELFNESYFDHPKSVDLVKRCIYMGCSEGEIVLDFFAGSGTTGHAVMQLNAEDSGNRKFILCQIDEPIKEDKPAYKFCIDNNLPPVISSITIERLKRAGEKIANAIEADNSKTGLFEEDKKQVPDIGFKVFDSVEAPKLKVDDKGQISFPENDTDALSRIYNMIFTVGLDEPTQVPEEVVKDCIYKVGNHYYITNSEKITSDDYSNAIKNGKVFIDGWTASLNGTLQNYKEDVKIVF